MTLSHLCRCQDLAFANVEGCGAKGCKLWARYHLLKPLYIHGRIKELQRAFRLRILLCHVDVDDAVEPLGQITKIALLNDCVLICAWSPEVPFQC